MPAQIRTSLAPRLAPPDKTVIFHLPITKDRIRWFVLAETPCASSMVENLNSRLRNYFFLRPHMGEEN